MIKFNPLPGNVVATLDNTLYDDYLCLVASNKQQIYVGRSQTSTVKLGKWSTPKRVRIRPKYSALSLSRDRRMKMDQSINQLELLELSKLRLHSSLEKQKKCYVSILKNN